MALKSAPTQLAMDACLEKTGDNFQDLLRKATLLYIKGIEGVQEAWYSNPLMKTTEAV